MASTIEKKPAVVKKPAVKIPAVKKPTTSKPDGASKAKIVAKPKVVKKAPTKKVVTKKAPAKKTSTTSSIKISAAERYRMIETAAYFIAERNNFSGNSTDYWIAAEAQIKKMLAK